MVAQQSYELCMLKEFVRTYKHKSLFSLFFSVVYK
uniref:Uncharacterized protein n=1 Tax=Arundo donax TaxID=35708 RepID=A0A0A9BCH3_ARUDO